MMAPAELDAQVVLSTTASRVPLRIEDRQVAELIAEAFKPGRACAGHRPPDAARPRRRTGAEFNVELAGHDMHTVTAASAEVVVPPC